MSKVILEIPYGSFVVDGKQALQMLDVLSNAERYSTKWRENNNTTHHIYPANPSDTFGMRILSDENYKMYKLAGKPED